jgi:hypothetical protein
LPEEILFIREPFYLKIFQQELSVGCLFVLTILINEPDAIQTIFTTVVANPELATTSLHQDGMCLSALIRRKHERGGITLGIVFIPAYMALSTTFPITLIGTG